MDALTSPAGAVSVAISALLLVMGYRLARPSRGREWLAVAAYGGALVAQTLGAVGLLGPVIAAGMWQRLAGALLLVAGVVLAGSRTRALRRAAIAGHGPPPPRRIDPVYAGLALVLVGQLLRAPSRPAAASVGVAVALAAWAAATPRRGGRAAG